MNEMLARNEEELALFNRMDEQRAKDDRAAWQSPLVCGFRLYYFWHA